MLVALLLLLLVSFLVAWWLTFVIARLAVTVGFVDKPGGRKIHARPKPLGGGIAIYWGIAIPALAAIALVHLTPPPQVGTHHLPDLLVQIPAGFHGRTLDASHTNEQWRAYWSGIDERTPMALAVLGVALLMHLLGLRDDRRALGPYFKLAWQLAAISLLAITQNVRVLTFLDHAMPGGRILSILITVLWIGAVTNAFNFLDNMDGLSAGIAAVSATAFLITTLLIHQWFVAAMLAMFLGAVLGFLCFNFPPASIFMGDSGSLVIGFFLGVLTVLTTFVRNGDNFAAGWYAVFAPVVVLAVPLYDLIVVSTIRMSRGRSPFVGDTNHFSHRLVARGMTRRTAVLCLYLITAATAVAAILLPQVTTTYAAMMIFGQTLLILGVVALLEQHPLPIYAPPASATPTSATPELLIDAVQTGSLSSTTLAAAPSTRGGSDVSMSEAALARGVLAGTGNAAMSPTSTARPRPKRDRLATDWLSWLTKGALVLLLAIVIARATMTESVREPFAVTVKSMAYPRAAGVGTSLVLDLACFGVGLLLLLRRAIDGSYILRWNCAHVLAALLALWIAISVKWADDKFIAIVGAANIAAAMVVLWSASQLVRSWSRLRLVSGVCFGLLLVYLAQAGYYRFVELPDTIQGYKSHRDEFLAQRGWKPDDYSTRQFEMRLKNGEILGFETSANSFAAVTVLLLGISAGALIQRAVEDEKYTLGWGAGLALTFIATAGVLYLTQSKAAALTAVLTALLLQGIGVSRSVLARHATAAYLAGIAVVCAFIAAVVAFGLHFGRLPSDSLNFRWRYWVAAWRMFLGHPWLGVGWANFGQHYLRYRLPIAAEEILDPHNFLIRLLTECGIVGAALMIGWMLSLWWQLTRPIVPPAPAPRTHAADAAHTAKHHASPLSAFAPAHRQSIIGPILAIVTLGMLINMAGSVDFAQDASWISLELLERLLWACALVIAAVAVSARGMQATHLDDRPCPWVLYGMLVALATFLVHNLIEFSIFENGPLMLFALVAGSALGVRQPTAAGKARHTRAARVWFGGGAIAWIAAIALTGRVLTAESLAQAADDAVRAGQVDQAADLYLDAFVNHVPLNADYIYRSAMARTQRPAYDPQAVQDLLDDAIAHNPSSVSYVLTRARMDEILHNASAVRRDYQRALTLNPNEVSIWQEYGDALMRLDDPAAAATAYGQAIHFNELLPREEPKRVNTAALRLRDAQALRGAGSLGAARDQLRMALDDDARLPAGDAHHLTDAQLAQVRLALSK